MRPDTHTKWLTTHSLNIKVALKRAVGKTRRQISDGIGAGTRARSMTDERFYTNDIQIQIQK